MRHMLRERACHAIAAALRMMKHCRCLRANMTAITVAMPRHARAAAALLRLRFRCGAAALYVCGERLRVT